MNSTNQSAKILNLISEAIKNTEFEGRTYVAGGFVRDLQLERSSDDIDIVVNLENGGQNLAFFLHEKGISTYPAIYKTFGTAKSDILGYSIEFVMTRKESYRKRCRFPSVDFGSLDEDVLRRDFTINSLLLNLKDNSIFDLTGKGIHDIRNKLIRTIAAPSDVFIEDPLRILRAVRFAAQLDFDISEDCLQSIKENHHLLKNLTIERINCEFTKILTSDKPAKGLELLIKTEMYKSIIPELGEMLNLEQNKYHDKDVWHHTLSVVENVPPLPELRLSALFHDIGKLRCMNEVDGVRRFFNHENTSAKIAKEILKKLKYSGKLVSEVNFLIKNHMRTKSFGANAEHMTKKAARKFLRDTKDYCDNLLHLIHADNISHAPEHQYPEQTKMIRLKLESAEEELKVSPLPVNGRDIIKHLKLKGSDIGTALKIAEDIYMDNPYISKDILLDKIKRKGYPFS